MSLLRPKSLPPSAAPEPFGAAVAYVSETDFALPQDFVGPESEVESAPILVAGYNAFLWHIETDGDGDVGAVVRVIDPATGVTVTALELFITQLAYQDSMSGEYPFGALITGLGTGYVWHTLKLACHVYDTMEGTRFRFALWCARR